MYILRVHKPRIAVAEFLGNSLRTEGRIPRQHAAAHRVDTSCNVECLCKETLEYTQNSFNLQRASLIYNISFTIQGNPQYTVTSFGIQGDTYAYTVRTYIPGVDVQMQL